MDTFSKSKYLFWGVIILAIINIALLVTFWMDKPNRIDHKSQFMERENQKPDKNHLVDFIIHELNLNQDQEKKFKEESKAHFEKADQMRGKVKEKKGELLEAGLKLGDVEKAKLIAEEIGKIQMQLEMHNLEHFTNLKTFLSAEQIEKFIDIFKEAFDKPGVPGMPPGMPPHPPKGGRPNGPPPF